MTAVDRADIEQRAYDAACEALIKPIPSIHGRTAEAAEALVANLTETGSALVAELTVDTDRRTAWIRQRRWIAREYMVPLTSLDAAAAAAARVLAEEQS